MNEMRLFCYYWTVVIRYIDSISDLNLLGELMLSAEERGEDQCNMNTGSRQLNSVNRY